MNHHARHETLMMVDDAVSENVILFLNPPSPFEGWLSNWCSNYDPNDISVNLNE